MHTLTDLYDELALEHGDPLEFLGEENFQKFPFRNCKEEIQKLVYDNNDFKIRLIEIGLGDKAFYEIDTEEYRRFLNKVYPHNNVNITNWLALNPDKYIRTMGRRKAIELLLALNVTDIKRANEFILRACGDDAYALYARDYRDLIYKFCLQNSLGIEKADKLIEEHKFIEMNSKELLKDVLVDLEIYNKEEITKNIDQIVWEGLCSGEKRKTAFGLKVISDFCETHKLKNDAAKGARKKYMHNATEENAYEFLKTVLAELAVCDEMEINNNIGRLIWEDFYQNEIMGGKKVIHSFCEKNNIEYAEEDAATLKYLNNYKLFKDLLYSLADECGAIESAQQFISGINWSEYYENEEKSGINKIREFSRINLIPKDMENRFVRRYSEMFSSKNKNTQTFTDDSNKLQTEEGLRNYLESNKDSFGMYRRTAYETFRSYYEIVANPIPDKLNEKKYGKDKLYDEVAFDKFYNHLVGADDDNINDEPLEVLTKSTEWMNRIHHNAARQKSLSIMQKIIKDGAVIDDTQLKEIKNKKEQVLRKYLIWVFIYTWGDIHDHRRPMDSLNDELRKCGMPELDSRNPFDVIVMNAMYYERREELRMKEEKGNLSNEDIRKIIIYSEEKGISAITEIKRIVKDVYNLEL